MTDAAGYQALGLLFAYPQEHRELTRSLELVAAGFGCKGTGSAAAPFAAFLREAPLAKLQEDYVATFDFDPARAPYLGHHLFGDPEKRATYLIRLKQTFARYGFRPKGCELPDHLSVLLNFLAHLDRIGEGEVRRRVVVEDVLPGVRKLAARSEFATSHWLSLVRTAELYLEAGSQEVSPC